MANWQHAGDVVLRRSMVGLTALSVVFALGLSGLAHAQPSASTEKPAAAASKSVKTHLSACLSLADRHHPHILRDRARLRHVKAQLREAHTAPFMQFTATGGVSLAPTVRGNNVFSPNTDASLTANLGVGWQTSVSGVVPLWTFGKITHLWDAAEAQVDLKRGQVEVTRDSVRYDVRRAYFGLQLARDALDLLANARKQLDKAEQKLEERVEEDEADPIDLFKMKTFAAELDAREAQGKRMLRVARASLGFLTGKPDIDIPDEPLKLGRHKLGGVERYLDAARLYRPEMRMVRAGLAARRAQVKLARSKLFPDLGLGLSVGLRAAPEVADQINPFVADGGNYVHYGAALVFRWNLDVLPALARIDQAKAQLDEVVAQEREALGGIAVEVKSAHAEAVDWNRRVQAYRKAQKFAKRWLATVQQSIDIGTMEEKELLAPAKAYAENRYKLYEAMMELNLAMSRLARVTGWNAIAPDGR